MTMDSNTTQGRADRPSAAATGSENRDLAIRLRDPERYVDACDDAADLLDWAETLLCNSYPGVRCSQQEWDRIITSWRDQKHGVPPNESSSATAWKGDAERKGNDE